VEAKYAIKVVPADWELETPLPFTQAEYDQARPDIESGTRILIYQLGPVDALVSEGAVSQEFIKLSDWPQQTKTNLELHGAKVEYLLPVRILYQRGTPARIPREQVRAALNDPNFPAATWMRISEEAYAQLRGGWV
jgi:hypothetical protein